jgi:hypothetical protein
MPTVSDMRRALIVLLLEAGVRIARRCLAGVVNAEAQSQRAERASHARDDAR